MRFLIFCLCLYPLSIFAQNPFDLLDKPKTYVDSLIGKPRNCDFSEGNTKQWAYPTSKYGSYAIAFVNDTAKAFQYKPNKTHILDIKDIPFTLIDAQLQPDAGKLLVSEADKPKILVELLGDVVKKITYLN